MRNQLSGCANIEISNGSEEVVGVGFLSRGSAILLWSRLEDREFLVEVLVELQNRCHVSASQKLYFQFLMIFCVYQKSRAFFNIKIKYYSIMLFFVFPIDKSLFRNSYL